MFSPMQNHKSSLLKSALLPFIVVIVIDQITKDLALRHSPHIEFLFFNFELLLNRGMFLGGFSQIPELYRVVILSTTGFFAAFIFFVVQFFVPIKSSLFRSGFSIFVAGIIGNILDRARYGYVVDFMSLHVFSFQTGIFNAADVFQWIGVALIFYELIRHGQILWPEEERRGRKWIQPDFQMRFCLLVVGLTLGCLITISTFSWTFLSTTITPLATATQLEEIAFSYKYLCVLCILICCISVFLFARNFSFRLVGPIIGFSEFLDTAMMGNLADFKVRQADEFQLLNQVAQRFSKQIIEKQGYCPIPLKKGARAPTFKGKTFNSVDFDLRDYRGKKVWLCLYRYTSCALCISHFNEIRNNFDRLLKGKIQVVAVFDNPKESFESHLLTGKIQEIEIPLISDPQKEIYRAYHTHSSVFAVFKPIVLVKAIKALISGARQGKITGELGQIPAHILIQEDGAVYHAHYGKNVADNISWSVIEKFLKI